MPPLDLLWIQLSEIEYYLKVDLDVFESRKEYLKKSQLSVVRFFSSQLIIKYNFRNLTFENLPSQIFSLNQEFKESQKSNRLTADSGHLQECGEISTDVYIAALISMYSTGIYDKKILRTWKKDVNGLSNQYYTIKWINRAEIILEMNLNDTVLILKNQREIREDKMLASLRVCIDENCNPNMLYYSHCMLVQTLIQSGVWGKEISDYLSELITKQWKTKIQFRAVFRMPNVNIPQIEDACNSDLPSIDKIGKILLAVRNAVNVRLPDELYQWLQNPVYLKG